MELKTAINLIEKGVPKLADQQIWADLGAGAGLFTKALASILPAGSTIYAVDKNGASMDSVETPDNGVTVKKIEIDFNSISFQIEDLDGLLMANSLHFIPDKSTLLKRLKSFLKPSGRIILIEYDTNDPSRWVPYPVSFDAFQKLVNTAFMSAEKVGETKSLFGRTNIYSALATPFN